MSFRVMFHTVAGLLVEIRIIIITLKWFLEIYFEIFDLFFFFFFALYKNYGYT